MVKCFNCNAAYRKAKTDFDVEGIVVKNVEAYKCPKCGEELYSPRQLGAIRKRINALSPNVSIERKISSAAGQKPIIYLPIEVMNAVGMKIGDVVSIGVEGKKRMVITPA